MDVTGKKHQRRGQLMIMNFSRRAAFCFLMSAKKKLCFCCLHVMEFWFVVCHPDQKLVL
jgi:hypothetical protein